MLTNKEYLKNFYRTKYGDIAEYIYNYPKPYKELCTNEIATACHVSPSTITRFIQQAGFDGFAHLKYQLDFTEHLSNQTAASTYLIRDILGEKQYRHHEQIAKIINQSKHVYIFMNREYKENLHIDLHELDQERFRVCEDANCLRGVINDPVQSKCIIFLGAMDLNIYIRMRQVTQVKVINIQIKEGNNINASITSQNLFNLWIDYENDVKNSFVSSGACLGFYLNFLFSNIKGDYCSKEKFN